MNTFELRFFIDPIPPEQIEDEEDETDSFIKKYGLMVNILKNLMPSIYVNYFSVYRKQMNFLFLPVDVVLLVAPVF